MPVIIAAVIYAMMLSILHVTHDLEPRTVVKPLRAQGVMVRDMTPVERFEYVKSSYNL